MMNVLIFPAEGGHSQLFVSAGLFLLGAAIVMILVRVIQKKYDPRQQGDKVGFSTYLSIEQIDEMYEKGMISQEEFKTLRKRVLSPLIDKEKMDSPSDSNEVIIEQNSENESSGEEGSTPSPGENEDNDEEISDEIEG